MDMDVSFGEWTMCTPVYHKMNTYELLLLSKRVCCQLAILKCHPDVKLQDWIVQLHIQFHTRSSHADCSRPTDRVHYDTSSAEHCSRCQVGCTHMYIIQTESRVFTGFKDQNKKPRCSRGFLSRFFIDPVNMRARLVLYSNQC